MESEFFNPFYRVETKDKKSYSCYPVVMNENFFPSSTLQTLFISRETSNCPLISEMIKLGQKLEEIGFSDKETGILSLNYGKRLLINAKNIDIKQMKQHDVVEIANYDPLKNIMMVIGTKDPCLEAPVHWIVQKARHDIHALFQINSTTVFEKLKGTLPTTDKEIQPISLDQAKEILKTLQNGKTILIKNTGIIFVGINIQEIQQALNTYLGERK